MNEGKPTRAKWWNRPRPQEGSPATDGDGDFELARPAEPAETRPPAPGPDDDYTLPPATAPRAPSDGDFELAVPQGPSAPGPSQAGPSGVDPAPVVSLSDAETPEGDAETGREAASAPGAVVEAPAPGASVTPAPGPNTPAGNPGTGTEAAPAPGAAADAPLTPAPPQDTTPRPLHDPDPYSTPPYGEPGPWAPAPPVQHPAATPAHGTPAAAVPGAPAPHPAPHQQPAPAHSAPHPQPAPAQSAPPSGPPAPHHQALPAPPAPPAHAVPDPAFADAPPPVVAAASGAPLDPWRNYDPWARAAERAVVGPLQESGAGVRRRRRGKGALLVGALVIALISGGVGGALGAYLERNGGLDTVKLPQAGVEAPGRAADSVAGIAARALPSVVTLHVSGRSEQGTGTGFVLDDRGHILTNNHVVEPAGSDGEISVTFHSGDTAKATVVGRDSGYDLAVVKVTGVSGLRPLPLGNSENVQVGDPVVAIGAPFDLEGTVTSGIISAKQRPITAGGESGDGSDVSYVDALQTDAPINPGNSGGPLLDGAGRVVGINSAIRSAGSGAEPDGGQAGSIGLGFAIPVNQAKRVAEELINTGKATHPVIGVTLDMGYSGDGARVGTKDGDGGPAVTKGGPGAKAGIEPGDVITEIDGARVHSGEELIIKTRAHRPGDRLELTLKRDGKEITLELTLGSSSGR
ncbi:trypsin-like peptidase domain-containing protein [Streptomyces sp. KAU_LT]|uniref:S1C family serine protease n=1 Tax=Streptomyces sp. KAU_LT TaxID=3046669 RepID=UPI0024B6819D|nr:trypsin-like peptidase domain-containing protein [Streptomyces sp. KAU_LT]MDI9831385.1 trypsin-like peptidase domain-containing protein [Streptomyces sp. KAU_LT]